MLAMLEPPTGALAGVATLRIPALEAESWTTDCHLGILGYAVIREQWGNGFATEGAACVTEFAFTALDLARLRATVLRSNLRSRRIVERLGFTVAEFGVR